MFRQEVQERLSSDFKVFKDTQPKESFSRDFDSSLFNFETPLTEIELKVGAYLGEKLFQPRKESIKIGLDGKLDPEYEKHLKKSVSYWREKGDESAAYRFEMELHGMYQLANLVMQKKSPNAELMPRMINGSDPGTTYATDEGAKTVVFVTEFDHYENYWMVFNQYSLPVDLMTLEDLWESIQAYGDLAQTAKVIGAQMGELTSETLVAYPVYVQSYLGVLNEIARAYGHVDWQQIKKKANEQFKLDNDEHAILRRNEFVNVYARRIKDALSRGVSKEEINIIDEAMRRQFALESGAEYLGLSVTRVEKLVSQMIFDVAAERHGLFESNASDKQREVFRRENKLSNLEMDELVVHRTWMIGAFRNNATARKALMTGCGGGITVSMGNEGLESWSREISFADMVYENPTMTDPFGYGIDTTTSVSETSSTGKYKEYYNYYRDTCRGPCLSEKPYVAHPKSSEVPCGYWCSDCET